VRREVCTVYKRKMSKQGYDTYLAGQAPALDAGLSLYHGTSRGRWMMMVSDRETKKRLLNIDQQSHVCRSLNELGTKINQSSIEFEFLCDSTHTSCDSALKISLYCLFTTGSKYFEVPDHHDVLAICDDHPKWKLSVRGRLAGTQGHTSFMFI